MPQINKKKWNNVQPGSPMSRGVCAAATALWLRGISRAHVSFGHSTNNAAREWAGGQTRDFCATLQAHLEANNVAIEAVLLNIIRGDAQLDTVHLGTGFHNGTAQYEYIEANMLGIYDSDYKNILTRRLTSFQAGHFGFISAIDGDNNGHAMGVVCLRTRGSFSKFMGTHPGTVNYYFFDSNIDIYNAITVQDIINDMMSRFGPGQHWGFGSISFGQLW